MVVMKWFFAIYFSILAIPCIAYATTAPLNAGIVNSIWYDKTELVAGSEITINTAFYNESAETISATALFHSDETLLGKVSFVSKPQTLTPVSLVWNPVPGSSVIRVGLEGGEVNVAATESKMTIEIKKPVVVEKEPVIEKEVVSVSTNETKKNPVVETILSLTEKMDAYTAGLADTIQTKKNPSFDGSSDRVGEVLSAQSDNEPLPIQASSSIVKTLEHKGIDGVTWIVRNWQWAGLGILVLMFFALRRRGR